MAKKGKKELIPVAEYAATNFNRRGFPISVSYLYRLIRQHKAGLRNDLPFDYEEQGQSIFIVKK